MSKSQAPNVPDTKSLRAVLCECADLIEAETIRIRLSVEGIDAFITGTDAATALSMGGAGTDRLIRVEVPEKDVQFAYDLLQEDKRLAIAAGPWICGRCIEQNEAAFELCWKCNKKRDETDERGRLDDPADSMQRAGDESIQNAAAGRAPQGDHANPYRPVVLPADHRVQTMAKTVHANETIRDDVMRAFRASVVGILVLPPLLTIYSFTLLLRTNLSEAYTDRSLRIWLIAAVCINAFVIIGVGEFARMMFFD